MCVSVSHRPESSHPPSTSHSHPITPSPHHPHPPNDLNSHLMSSLAVVRQLHLASAATAQCLADIVWAYFGQFGCSGGWGDCCVLSAGHFDSVCVCVLRR